MPDTELDILMRNKIQKNKNKMVTVTPAMLMLSRNLSVESVRKDDWVVTMNTTNCLEALLKDVSRPGFTFFGKSIPIDEFISIRDYDACEELQDELERHNCHEADAKALFAKEGVGGITSALLSAGVVEDKLDTIKENAVLERFTEKLKSLGLTEEHLRRLDLGYTQGLNGTSVGFLGAGQSELLDGKYMRLSGKRLTNLEVSDSGELTVESQFTFTFTHMMSDMTAREMPLPEYPVVTKFVFTDKAKEKKGAEFVGIKVHEIFKPLLFSNLEINFTNWYEKYTKKSAVFFAYSHFRMKNLLLGKNEKSIPFEIASLSNDATSDVEIFEKIAGALLDGQLSFSGIPVPRIPKLFANAGDEDREEQSKVIYQYFSEFVDSLPDSFLEKNSKLELHKAIEKQWGKIAESSDPSIGVSIAFDPKQNNIVFHTAEPHSFVHTDLVHASIKRALVAFPVVDGNAERQALRNAWRTVNANVDHQILDRKDRQVIEDACESDPRVLLLFMKKTYLSDELYHDWSKEYSTYARSFKTLDTLNEQLGKYRDVSLLFADSDQRLQSILILLNLVKDALNNKNIPEHLRKGQHSILEKLKNELVKDASFVKEVSVVAREIEAKTYVEEDEEQEEGDEENNGSMLLGKILKVLKHSEHEDLLDSEEEEGQSDEAPDDPSSDEGSFADFVMIEKLIVPLSTKQALVRCFVKANHYPLPEPNSLKQYGKRIVDTNKKLDAVEHFVYEYLKVIHKIKPKDLKGSITGPLSISNIDKAKMGHPKVYLSLLVLGIIERYREAHGDTNHPKNLVDIEDYEAILNTLHSVLDSSIDKTNAFSNNRFVDGFVYPVRGQVQESITSVNGLSKALGEKPHSLFENTATFSAELGIKLYAFEKELHEQHQKVKNLFSRSSRYVSVLKNTGSYRTIVDSNKFVNEVAKKLFDADSIDEFLQIKSEFNRILSNDISLDLSPFQKEIKKAYSHFPYQRIAALSYLQSAVEINEYRIGAIQSIRHAGTQEAANAALKLLNSTLDELTTQRKDKEASYDYPTSSIDDYVRAVKKQCDAEKVKKLEQFAETKEAYVHVLREEATLIFVALNSARTADEIEGLFDRLESLADEIVARPQFKNLSGSDVEKIKEDLSSLKAHALSTMRRDEVDGEQKVAEDEEMEEEPKEDLPYSANRHLLLSHSGRAPKDVEQTETAAIVFKVAD